MSAARLKSAADAEEFTLQGEEFSKQPIPVHDCGNGLVIQLPLLLPSRLVSWALRNAWLQKLGPS